MISFVCQCGKPFRFSLKFRGRPFRCNSCGRSLVVPEESIPSTTADGKQLASADSGEMTTPGNPLFELDLPALQTPHSSETSTGAPIQSLPGRMKHNMVDGLEDEEILLSGSSSKARDEENAFHIALGLEEDSTSTILSKAAISQQIKEEQEQLETVQAANAKAGQKPPKKGGLLSGFFKKKPVIPAVIDITENKTEKPVPAPKTSEKASKKRLSASVPTESPAEKPKNNGFFSGLFKKKPVTPKEPKTPVSK